MSTATATDAALRVPGADTESAAWRSTSEPYFTTAFQEMHLHNEKGEPLGIKLDGVHMGRAILLTDLVTGSSFALKPEDFDPHTILAAALQKRVEFRAASTF